MRQLLKWMLLVAATVAVTVPLTLVGVPSAALFAALVVGTVLALLSLTPRQVPRRAGVAAQGALGVYIGTMVDRDGISALGSDWPIVVGIAVATLLLSVVAGVLLGLHRDVSALTGSLALLAGGASGLVAIARELGGDERIVSVVQYVRVALITASMPVVVTFIFRSDTSHPGSDPSQTQADSAPWYLSLAMLILVMVLGTAAGRLMRLPGASLLGPLALTVVLELTGLSFGLTVPMALVHVTYMVIGWQAGLAFTSESLRAVTRVLPAALALIVGLGVTTAGLGVLLARVTQLSPLEGYLATSPGGVYAVLATAVETGSNVTFIIAAQVLRVLLMLFTGPLLARGMAWVKRRRGAHNRAMTAASNEPIRSAD